MGQDVTIARVVVRWDACPGPPSPSAPVPQPLPEGNFLPPSSLPTPTARWSCLFSTKRLSAPPGREVQPRAPSVVALETPEDPRAEGNEPPWAQGDGTVGGTGTCGARLGEEPQAGGTPSRRTTQCLEQKGPEDGQSRTAGSLGEGQAPGKGLLIFGVLAKEPCPLCMLEMGSSSLRDTPPG